VEYAGIFGPSAAPKESLMQMSIAPPPANGSARSLGTGSSAMDSAMDSAVAEDGKGEGAGLGSGVYKNGKDKADVGVPYRNSPIAVKAPEQASKVAVSYADGTTDILAFDSKTGRWLGSLGRPFSAVAGVHRMTVTVTLKNGKQESFSLEFNQASFTPDFMMTLEEARKLMAARAAMMAKSDTGFVAKPGADVAVTLISVDAAKAAVTIPGSPQQTLVPASETVWVGALTVSSSQNVGLVTLGVSVTDKSNNAIVIEIGLMVE